MVDAKVGRRRLRLRRLTELSKREVGFFIFEFVGQDSHLCVIKLLLNLSAITKVPQWSGFPSLVAPCPTTHEESGHIQATLNSSNSLRDFSHDPSNFMSLGAFPWPGMHVHTEAILRILVVFKKSLKNKTNP